MVSIWKVSSISLGGPPATKRFIRRVFRAQRMMILQPFCASLVKARRLTFPLSWLTAPPVTVADQDVFAMAAMKTPILN
jgi:hypothetical protein